MPAAKFVPVFPGPILMGIDVHARSRFDRFSHHAHGQGGWIAATGGVRSRFSGRARCFPRKPSVGVCKHLFTTSFGVNPLPPLSYILYPPQELKCGCKIPKRRGYRCRLASLATSADGTAVVTTSIRGFLPFRFSKFDPRRTQWQPPGEPVRLPERLHQGSRSASPAREMRSRARATSKRERTTAARLGRVARGSAWPAAVSPTNERW